MLQLDFSFGLVDLAIVVVVVLLLSYGFYCGVYRTRTALPGGWVMIATGFLLALFSLLYELFTAFVDPATSVAAQQAAPADLLRDTIDWGASRAALLLISIGLMLILRQRRQTERDQRFHEGKMEAMQVSRRNTDERFQYLFDNTPNSVYCYEFRKPVSIYLPIEEQIACSHNAVLTQCNPMFARELGSSNVEDVIGGRFGALDSSKDTRAHAAFFTAFVQNDYRLTGYELIYKSPQGKDCAVSMNLIGVIKDGCLSRMWGIETNIRDLRETKAALEARRAFHRLVADVSSRLVKASNTEADTVVDECMASVCTFIDADRSIIFWLDEDENSLSVAHEWHAVGGPFDGPVSLDAYPEIVGHLRKMQPVRVDDVRMLPEKFSVDRESFESVGIRAIVILPMIVAGEVVGGMTIGRVNNWKAWTTQEIQDLKVLCELFANFVLQLKSRRALHDALSGLQRATDRLEAENVYLREEIELTHGFDEIIGESQGVLRSLQLVEQVAGTRTPVLLLGETGTGKELVARAIHDLSDRRDRPLVKVNCAALPANLIESELFGHEKGAFTGAESAKRGRFDLAAGSTLFLDEIGEIPLELQSKLLRVLQEGEFERLGGTKTNKVDVRIVVATNRNLSAAVIAGDFRSDLYYRINTFPIELPPLRERDSDVELLARHFVHLHASRLNRHIEEISSGMMRQLRAYHWPGNVRELEGIIQRALISSSGPVLELAEPLVSTAVDDGLPKIISSSIADLKLVERDHIISVLEESRWKISGDLGAAARLGLPPSTLRSKMKKLGIERPV